MERRKTHASKDVDNEKRFVLSKEGGRLPQRAPISSGFIRAILEIGTPEVVDQKSITFEAFYQTTAAPGTKISYREADGVATNPGRFPIS